MSKELPDLIPIYDKSNMLDLILHFSDQVKDAINIGNKAAIGQPADSFSQILVAGMGGSAIGGNILQKLFTASGTIPCNVIRDYRLPAWAGQHTLVLISSFSGNTEETIAAYESAIFKGCSCLVCTSGGKVLEIAKNKNHPVIQIPGGRPPRTALGYLLFPFLVNFIKWGMIKSSLVDYSELAEILKKIAAENNPLKPATTSKALEIAQACVDRLPIFYSSDELSAVGMRWKGQICENSKVLSYNNSFPEMNHNEIIGWQSIASMNLNEQLAVFLLRDKDDHPRVQKRMDIVRELIIQSQTPTYDIFSEGESLLTRMFSLIYLADFVSFNLAILNQEDPTPIKNIDFLKSSLADEEK